MVPKKVALTPKKKVAAKKLIATAPKKTSVKKAAPRTAVKTVAKKVATKRVTKPQTKRKATVEKNIPSTRAKKPKVEPEVTLPINASIRAREKVLALKYYFDTDFQNVMSNVAYVGGVCFVILGTTLTSTYLMSAATNSQVAQIANSQLTSTTSTPKLVAQIIKPVYTLLTSVPATATESFAVDFSITNVDNVFIRVKQLSSGGFMPDIAHQKKTGDTYRFTIPADTYPAGSYMIYFYVQPTNSTLLSLADTQGFLVNKTAAVTVPATSTSTSTQTPDTTFVPAPPKEIEVTTNETFDTNDQTPLAQSGKIFAVFTTDDTLFSGVQKVGVSTPEEYTFVELYARPLNATDARFLSLATKVFDRWQFVVDTEKQLPNGQYEIFAQTRTDVGVVKSKSLIVTVKNVVSTTAPSVTDTQVREQVTTQTDPAQYAKYIAEQVQTETAAILYSNEVEINSLIQNYAAARQGADELLIEEAKKALQEKRQEIATNTLENGRFADIADDIDEQIAARFENLQNRIDTFEQVRAERSSGNTALDTDKDGISDFDEIHLYKTDPMLADSDNDGVSDGIEIVRGYNPNDDTAEAVIRFESPKESVGLEYKDVLRVTSVEPVIVESTQDSPVRTMAEIKGFALPNSFVTLYIFSSPIVVTVKTEDDGSFAYSFDKELEDGQHDVYVAITDNAGEIIAQSESFSFIKRAEAFTPVDATEAAVDNSNTPTIVETTNNTYRTVAGMGILALGLILIILGISLRSKKEEELPLSSANSLEEIDLSA